RGGSGGIRFERKGKASLTRCQVCFTRLDGRARFRTFALSHFRTPSRSFTPAVPPPALPPRRPPVSTRFPNLTVIEHPLIQHKLAVLRDRETSKKKFKELVDEISML